MTDDTMTEINADQIHEILVEEGYEVVSTSDPNTFQVRDLESGLTITCVLAENILFNTLPCFTMSTDKISLELTKLLLDASNGISTSAFQLYANGDRTQVTLNNFCKLLDLGPEDRDDILSCVTFLEVDAMAARQLLADIVES